MNSRKFTLCVNTVAVLIALLILSSFVRVTSPVRSQQIERGPRSDVIIFKRVPSDLAPEALKKGEIDYYLFHLRPVAAEALKGVKEVKLYYAPAGIVDIILNPAPAPEGELNPFSIREVRFAINYLIDRDYVVNEIYKGFAAPMYCFLSQYDPDYVTIYDIIAKYEFKYDPALADQIITKALTEAGAYKEGGKWYYNGKPIVLKFVIRIEDERREIGDALASELEKLGFTVERLYMPFGQAIPTVYGTDPKDFEWHLYTEGWGKSAPDKYDYGTINQFGAPWFGYMPGWQEAGYWNYQNATIDDLGKRIFYGNFTSRDERDQLYRRAAEMIIQEAVRIFIATSLDIYPARSEVKGLTNDLGAGLRAPWNPREAYVEGRSKLVVGHEWVWTEGTAWNPIAGFQDVYSVDIWRACYDPFTWRHPFSGEPIPFRIHYTVETAGPNGKLDVPPDAFVWDANSDQWVNVGEGVKAISKVVFDMSTYVGCKWHNNQTITWADVLYGIAQLYEITYDVNKSAIESSIAAFYESYFNTIKGYRIVDDRYLEVYVDYWHFDPNYIADYAVPPAPHVPWEIDLAMDKLVFEEKKFAYSDSASEKYNVPWLSLVLKDHAEAVKEELEKFKAEGYFPANYFTVNGKTYATKEEAMARYDAAIHWIETHGHAVISDGPFYLYRFDPAAQYAELRAFRDPTYPFKPGDWYYGMPTPVEIVSVGIPTVVPGGEAKFVVELRGSMPLGVKYLIRDPTTGKILISGVAKEVTPTRFVISLSSDFTSSLMPGLYELLIVGYSSEVALVSAERQFFDVLNIKPLESAFEKAVAGVREKVDAVSGQLGALSGQLATLNTNLQTATKAIQDTVASLKTLVMVAIILSVINLVMVAIVLVKRK